MKFPNIRLIALVSLVLPAVWSSSQDLGLGTAYYYDLYGGQVSDKEPPKLNFSVPWRGSISPPIKSNYIQRIYKSGKLTVTVYYSRPDLKAVAVEYRLPHAWTDEQLEKALEVYSKKWANPAEKHHPAGVFSGIIRQKVLMSEEGLYAHLLPYSNRLAILSPEILKEFDRVLRLREEKRKEVPEF